MDTGGETQASCWEWCCKILGSRSTPRSLAPRSFHSPLPSMVFPLKKDKATAESILFSLFPRGTPWMLGSWLQALQPCHASLPGRQALCLEKTCLPLSCLPIGFPRKKDDVSRYWDKWNKHTFKIEPRSPLVFLQAGVIQLATPGLYYTLRDLSPHCHEWAKHRVWLSLSSVSAPPCNAGGIATSARGGAQLLSSALRRNASWIRETSIWLWGPKLVVLLGLLFSLRTNSTFGLWPGFSSGESKKRVWEAFPTAFPDTMWFHFSHLWVLCWGACLPVLLNITHGNVKRIFRFCSKGVQKYEKKHFIPVITEGVLRCHSLP